MEKEITPQVRDQNLTGSENMQTATLNKETVWLIGFIIDPDAETPQAYTAFFPDVTDEPLLSEGYIVFFESVELATKAIESGDNNYPNFIYPPDEVDLVCNIAELFYLITYEKIDTSAILVDCLNIMFDLVKATKLTLPAEYRSILYAFADHLTFQQEFESFFTDHQTSRLALTNALTWCVGAIVSKSKFINHSK